MCVRACVWERWVMMWVRTYSLIINFSNVQQEQNKSWKAWHFQTSSQKQHRRELGDSYDKWRVCEVKRERETCCPCVNKMNNNTHSVFYNFVFLPKLCIHYQGSTAYMWLSVCVWGLESNYWSDHPAEMSSAIQIKRRTKAWGGEWQIKGARLEKRRKQS